MQDSDESIYGEFIGGSVDIRYCDIPVELWLCSLSRNQPYTHHLRDAIRQSFHSTFYLVDVTTSFRALHAPLDEKHRITRYLRPSPSTKCASPRSPMIVATLTHLHTFYHALPATSLPQHMRRPRKKVFRIWHSS